MDESVKPRSPPRHRRARSPSVQISPRHSSMVSSKGMKSVTSVPEITHDEYFRLLRKTDVLGYLVRVNGDLETKEARLESAEMDNAKLSAVQRHLAVEYELVKSQLTETKRVFLDHLAQLTHGCLEEEALQSGHSSEAAIEFADAQSKTRQANDLHRLQRAADPNHFDEGEVGPAVLAKLAKERLTQYGAICRAYRKELRRVETLSYEQESKGAAAHSTEHLYTESIESALTSVQSEKAQLADRMTLVVKQNDALEAQVASLQAELDGRRSHERLLRAQWAQQEQVILHLLTTVKGDIKKRFGFIPPALEHHSFAPQHAPPPPPFSSH
ncbi:hypothetical protein ACHHYP_15233 [Achlya hypogyna]|uniref:Uncharacterized protein n=1 Tax=Achlya hypogyna TaxID=1202772 RepID=A0A1V9YBA6_ACHHY|nr:hypothetical protein ACHHYP_15233 [Achlya hypogyna]